MLHMGAGLLKSTQMQSKRSMSITAHELGAENLLRLVSELNTKLSPQTTYISLDILTWRHSPLLAPQVHSVLCTPATEGISVPC